VRVMWCQVLGISLSIQPVLSITHLACDRISRLLGCLVLLVELEGSLIPLFPWPLVQGLQAEALHFRSWTMDFGAPVYTCHSDSAYKSPSELANTDHLDVKHRVSLLA
jgi:hypothetical protein